MKSEYPTNHAELLNKMKQELFEAALWFPEIYRQSQEYLIIQNDSDQINKLQHERLGNLLLHASNKVPFYKNLITDKSGIKNFPWDSLMKFPVIDRSILRTDFYDLCRDDIDPVECRYSITSGTSGEKIKVILDRSHRLHSAALELARLSSYGMEFEDRLLSVYKRKNATQYIEYTSPALGYLRVLEVWPSANVDDPVLSLNDAYLRIKFFNPNLIQGHPSELLEFARWFSESSLPLPTVKIILTSGENLEPPTRDAIMHHFNGTVYDTYGMREISAIATQCKFGTYHIESEKVIVEVLNADGQSVPEGGEGELVVTNLLNYAMPIIRYRTGDIGSLSKTKCECGLPHPILQRLDGRFLGYIYLENGERVNPRRLIHLFIGKPVEQFQIIQEDLRTLQIRVVPEINIPTNYLEDLKNEFEGFLNNNIRVTVLTEPPLYSNFETKKVDSFVSFLPKDQISL
jgi:phenylacetate-CoA ligase